MVGVTGGRVLRGLFGKAGSWLVPSGADGVGWVSGRYPDDRLPCPVMPVRAVVPERRMVRQDREISSSGEVPVYYAAA
jgi:hypothetical protein